MTALRIGDEPLKPATLVAAARGGKLEVELTASGRERMTAARHDAESEAERRPVYGLTTGVGALHQVAVRESDLRAHSVRLLRSHAGGVGDALPDEVVRGTILVRLAQMAAGGGGQRPEIAETLAAVLRERPLPVLRDLGGIGTGDLTLLSQLRSRSPARASGARKPPPRRGSRSRPATGSRSSAPTRRRSPPRRWPGPTCASCSTPASASRR